MRVFKTDKQYVALGEWHFLEVLIMGNYFYGGGYAVGNFNWSMWVPESSHLGLLYGGAHGHKAENNYPITEKRDSPLAF